MRRRRFHHNHSSPLEEILWLVLKPPTWLIVAGGILLIGSVFFHYDYFYWASKISKPYTDKVVGVIGSVISAVIPSK